MNTATQTVSTNEAIIENDPLLRDFKTAAFIVSIVINLALLTGWIALQIRA